MPIYISSQYKYRAKTLDEFVFPNNKVKDVVMAYATGNIRRPLLLSGPNGTGKSLLAQLIPAAIEGRAIEVKKWTADDLQKSELLVKAFNYDAQFARLFAPDGQRMRYHLIEEMNVRMRNTDRLKVILDNESEYDLTFITTNAVSNIDIGLRSRCELLTVEPCAPDLFLPHAMKIFEKERVEIDPGALLIVLQDQHNRRPDNREYYKVIDQIFRNIP
jgi:DNA polymerase III delta prime subunit